MAKKTKKAVKKGKKTPRVGLYQRTEQAGPFPADAALAIQGRTYLKNKDGSTTVLVNITFTDSNGEVWKKARVLRFKHSGISGQRHGKTTP